MKKHITGTTLLFIAAISFLASFIFGGAIGGVIGILADICLVIGLITFFKNKESKSNTKKKNIIVLVSILVIAAVIVMRIQPLKAPKSVSEPLSSNTTAREDFCNKYAIEKRETAQAADDNYEQSGGTLTMRADYFGIFQEAYSDCMGTREE